MSTFDEYTEVIYWDFTRKNNVNYNFDIIECLITCATKNQNPSYFYKPIFLITSSIIECTLYDFLTRAHQIRHEPIENIDPQDLLIIQNTDLPKRLVNFNEICRKYEFLGDKEDQIYEEIRKIAALRNRVHIQNDKKESPVKEEDLWTSDDVKHCGNLLKRIYFLLCTAHSRPESFHTSPNIEKFPEPWALL